MNKCDGDHGGPKCSDPEFWNALVIHGHSCKKEPHTFKRGYLHAEDDDTPYDVDGIKYCGRCHTFLDLQAAQH